jgi:hypothetical protein
LTQQAKKPFSFQKPSLYNIAEQVIIQVAASRRPIALMQSAARRACAEGIFLPFVFSAPIFFACRRGENR